MAKRGRPKTRVDVDNGTPELRLKQKNLQTLEPIDLYFRKSLITSCQHRAGLHFRWLHAVKYGIAKVTSSHVYKQYSPEYKSLESLERTERYYAVAYEILKKNRSQRQVVSVCVHNEILKFAPNSKHPEYKEYKAFVAGLEALAKHWKYQA